MLLMKLCPLVSNYREQKSLPGPLVLSSDFGVRARILHRKTVKVRRISIRDADVARHLREKRRHMPLSDLVGKYMWSGTDSSLCSTTGENSIWKAMLSTNERGSENRRLVRVVLDGE